MDSMRTSLEASCRTGDGRTAERQNGQNEAMGGKANDINERWREARRAGFLWVDEPLIRRAALTVNF
jgi:hypothetical protein